ncbi:S-adenosyl-L-methionine-dependent methyltransferase [Amanita muscaria]
MSTQLRQLLDLINGAAATLDKSCSVNGTRIPDPHEPFYPESEAFRTDPIAENAANIIGAAALQLAALVLPPHLVMFSMIGGQWNCAALRLCVDTHVTEILREAGPEGMHVKDIEAKNGIDASKMARCLRLLSIQHVYREVKPDVFANTRLSTLLDTLKPSKKIIADPEHKHDHTNGFPAFASFLLDEWFKSSAYLLENITDPKTRKSGDPADAPFARPDVHGKSIWEFYGQPEKKVREQRFNIGMKGLLSMLPGNFASEAFDWRSLPKDALVVDVGGGVGMVPMAIAREHSHLKFVIQDRPTVVENGIQIWKQEMPSALQSGRVKLEAHDFFKTQPQKDASVFILKHILHNWADDYSLTILKHLRAAATPPKTRLICIDAILPYACRDAASSAGGIPGAVTVEAPEPLIANWGLVSGTAFYMDSIMMMACNSQERTIGQFDELFRKAGWKIVAVRHGSATRPLALAAIEAVPIEYERKQPRSRL